MAFRGCWHGRSRAEEAASMPVGGRWKLLEWRVQALREVQGLRRADGCQCGGGLAIFAGFP